MKRKLVVGSKNQEFHARMFLSSLKSGAMVMDMNDVKQHLLRASGSMQFFFIFLFNVSLFM